MAGLLQNIWNIITNPIAVIIETKLTEWIINKILDRYPNIGYVVRYGWKSLVKTFWDSPINIIYTFKISDLTISLDEYENKLKNLLKEYKFKGQKDYELIYTHKYGNIQPEIVFSASFDNNENNEIFISGIQIDLKLKTGYRNFKDEVNDLDKLKQELNSRLESDLNEIKSESLTCSLRGAYKLTGIPTDIKIKSLYGELGRNKIDLSHNKIIVYNMVLSPELSDLKKIITYYY